MTKKGSKSYWERRRAWRSPRDLDPACRALCAALNRLPGIRTTGSCEGHGKQAPSIFLQAASLRALEPIARAVDPRYYGTPKNPWRVQLDETDFHHDRVTFLLTCEGIPRSRQKHLDRLAIDVADAAAVLGRWTKEHWCDAQCDWERAVMPGYADVPAVFASRRLPPGHSMIGGVRIVHRAAGQWEVRAPGCPICIERTRKGAYALAHDLASALQAKEGA